MGVKVVSKKIFNIIYILLFFAFPGTTLAQLADTPWPMFHHDLRHTGKTANFGTQVGKLKWQFVTGGPVTSSPVIDNNETVYIGSADNNFYAINSETGALEWKYTTGGAIELSSPAIDEDGIVYIGSNDGYLYAFDTETLDPLDPEPKWTFKTDGAISSSPAIDSNGNILFSSADGYIYSIFSNGTLDWKTKIGTSWCSPAIDTTNSHVYVGSWINQNSTINFIEVEVDNATIQIPARVNFFALNSSNGSILWDFPYFCTPGGILASPVIASDKSIIVSFFMTYNKDCDDEESDFHIWSLESDGDPNWGLQLGGINDIYTTPAMLEDNSFFIASSSDIYRVLPDGQTYLSSPGDGERIESSPAIDGGKLIFFGSNGGRFYCICADCPETPILWQYPPADEDPLQKVNVGGTISIASIISSPAIGDDDRHSVYVGGSDGNVYAFYDGPRISGKVELVETDNENKTPLRATKIILTSEFMGEERVTYTDTNGNYEFAGVENYTYTVTPEKIGYVFSPESRRVSVKQDQDALNINFEAFTGFAISGTINDSDGNSVAGATLTIDGEKSPSATTTTDSNGQYEFTGLSFDTYIITPSLDGFGFTPPFQEVTIASTDTIRDKDNIDFTATQGYQISGKVLDITTEETNKGIDGVQVSLTGDATASTTTDDNGAYSFVGLENGSYTVTPQFSDYTFEPSSQAVTIVSSNVDNLNFVAATGSTISGYIQIDSCDNSTINNVTVDLFADYFSIFDNTGEQHEELISSVHPTTDGYYVFIGIGSGTYTIKPRLAGCGFDPFSRTVTLTDDDITNQNFIVQEGFYISGKITNALGNGVIGVTVSIEGNENASTETNEDGVYSFTGLSSGTYTITVDQEGYTSMPDSQTVEIFGASKENVDFIVRPICPVVYLNIPFFGSKGSLVNIFGVNFGMAEPPEELMVQLGDTGITLPAGVYFGTSDPETWVKAEVKLWSPIKIVAEAPGGFGVVSVWVLNETECYYTNAMATNIFILGF